jgi:hypothetical protein
MEVCARATPFATHIFPLRPGVEGLEVSLLAFMPRGLLAKICLGLNNPNLNFTIRSGSSNYVGAGLLLVGQRDSTPHAHVAGFELASGMFSSTILPQAATEFLRKTSPEKAGGTEEQPLPPAEPEEGNNSKVRRQRKRKGSAAKPNMRAATPKGRIANSLTLAAQPGCPVGTRSGGRIFSSPRTAASAGTQSSNSPSPG